MCGIIGIITRNKRIYRSTVEAMASKMIHRGPDGEGYWFSKNQKIALGHRRLSIIDLSDKAKQPMLDSSSKYIIVFNGEIYNYLEIKNELKLLGVVFNSESDTEVILESYKVWGVKCLDKFNGMFAFALYDSIKELFFCARDRYGEKPFLYSFNEDFFAFASEYKALLTIKDISTDIDEYRLIQAAYNQSTGIDANENTVFNEIKQLLPSQAMLLDLKSWRQKTWKYWDVTIRDGYKKLNEKDAFALFRELLIDSVKLRLRSDVPVGSCLSGGLDSSAIVSIVKKKLLNHSAYHTFSGIFPNSTADEWLFAEKVVKDTDVISHRVVPSPDKFNSELEDFVWYNELPVGSSSQYAQYCVFRLAKEAGVVVLLDGQGSDELLGGYEQYFQKYIETLQEIGDRERLEQELPNIWERYPLALNPKSRAMRDSIPFPLRYFYANLFKKGTNLSYGLKYRFAIRARIDTKIYRDKRFTALTSSLYQESFGRFLNTLLRYGDRNSMAHSREVRLPFCDYRLPELVFSLPPSYMMGNVQTKRVLRESMNGILIDEIRLRWNKKGFLPPQQEWFKGELLERAKDILNSRHFRESSYWDRKWWEGVLKRIEKGNRFLGWVIWHPFIMESWFTYFYQRIKSLERFSVFER